jgi:mxaJ protein
VCDALIGVPAGFEPMLTTRAYYRSAYMFARRSDRSAPLSFDDPVLRTAKIGLPLIGDDGTASPPGYALAALGIINNVSGYPRYGAGPQAQRLIAGIASGELDLAVVWGPQAAYYARMQTAPIVLNYVPPPAGARVPFDYAMAIGVARKNGALRDELDAALARTRPEIDAILQAYQVPRLDAPQDSIGVVSQ